MKKFQSIQALRIFAATWVMLFHFMPHYDAMRGADGWFRSFSLKGHLGVDIFFVVSGFVVAASTEGFSSSVRTAARFLLRRMLRIYAPYWLSLVFPCFVLLAYRIGFANIKIIQSTFLTTVDQPSLLNPAAWFLFYLILLYFMFSVSLMVRDKYREAVWWFFLLLGIASFRFYFLVKWHILPLTLEFFAGALFFRHMNYFNTSLKIALIAILGVAAGAAGLYYKTDEGFYRYLTYGIAAICLLASLVLMELRVHVSLPAIIDKAADSSYALYLLHLSFIGLFFLTGYRDWLLSMPGVPKYLGFLLYIMMIFWIARLFHRWCEQPVLRCLTRCLDAEKNVSKAGTL